MATNAQLESCLTSFFESDKLDRFADEWSLAFRGNDSISRLGYCTNLTPHTVEEAVHHEVGFLLTHHDAWPFLWGMPEACTSKLEAHGISNSFFHLPLDDADFGTSATLAKRLELCNVEKSTLYSDTFYCGRIGEWEREKSLDDVNALLEATLGEALRVWRNHNRPIRRICIVAGGGGMTGDIKEACDRGCDAYITGEKSLYTVEYAKFLGIDLVVGSHTGTELPGVESLAQRMARELGGIQVVHLCEDRIE